MEQSLFGNQLTQWTLDDLRKADFEYFKKFGYYLNYDHIETIDKFYGICYSSYEKVQFYHCLPLLNTIVSNHEYRFILVNVKDDVLFLAYKVIQIMTTKQIRIFDIPISQKISCENVQEVINVLKDKGFLRFAVQKDFLEYYKGFKIEKLESYNNYFYSFSKLKSLPNKKLKGWRIKSLVENKDFSFGLYDCIDIDAVRELREDFNIYLIERGSKPSPKDDKEFYRLATQKSGRKKVMPIYYKGILISITVFMIYQNVAYNLYQIERKHYDLNDTVLSKMLKYNMEEKTKYIAFKLFGDIERIYILGAMPSEKRLLAHKERTSDGKIEYFIL